MDESGNIKNEVWLPDEEFINGKVPLFITRKHKSLGVLTDHIFTVLRDGERRDYSPVEFLVLVMKAHYAACDKADSFEEQLSGVINAKSTINRYIWENELDKFGYNFERIFNDLEITKERIETYINCKIPYKKLDENNKKDNTYDTNSQQIKDTTVRSDYIKQTIHEYLEPFKSEKAFNEKEYPFIIETLRGYFENKKNVPEKPYFVSYGNTKRLAYALGSIYTGLMTESLCFGYLDLCRKSFSCFSKPVHKISEVALVSSTLYKYFVTKPKQL